MLPLAAAGVGAEIGVGIGAGVGAGAGSKSPLESPSWDAFAGAGAQAPSGPPPAAIPDLTASFDAFGITPSGEFPVCKWPIWTSVFSGVVFWVRVVLWCSLPGAVGLGGMRSV